MILAIYPGQNHVILILESRLNAFFNPFAPCLIDLAARDGFQRLLGIGHAREFIDLVAVRVEYGIDRFLLHHPLFRRLVDLPEILIRILQREAHQGVADAVLLGANDVSLPLHGDVGDDIDHLLTGAHCTLA